MTRFYGSLLAGILFFEWAGAAQAQLVSGDPYEPGSAYDGYFYGNEPYGGFGLEFNQHVPDGSVIMDRFGMLYVASRARTPQIMTPPPSAPTRPRVRESRSDTRRVQAQPHYQLPTGSLYWPGANSGILYSPEMRYQSYGGGYGRSPYGSVDHGSMYKGWWLGY